MVFENVTALELHLHTGEEDPTAPLPRTEPATESSTDSGSPLKWKAMLAAMLVVSVVLSIAVTVVVRKFRASDESDD